MTFEEKTIGQLTTFSNNLRKPVTKSDREGGSYPYYGAAGIQDFVADYLFDGEYILVGEDGTVLSNGEYPVVQRVAGKFWVNNHAHVIRPLAMSDFDFLYYSLVGTKVKNLVTGAVQPKLSMTNLKSLEILWPNDSDTRRVIGRTLNFLDEKIAINKKLSKTMEDIAQTIFKSWFVDFDPVKAKMAGEEPVGMDAATAALFPDSMEDSELGLIPKGWKSVALDNFASVRYGAPFASKLFNVSAVGSPLIRIRDLKNQSIATWTTDRLAKGFFVKAGQLLVGMDGEFNPTLWFGEDSLVNQRICLIDNNQEISSLYLYFSLLPIMKRIEHGSTGSTVIHLGKSDIDAIRIMHPGIELLENYKTIVSPMLDEIVSLSKQSRNLQLIRDVLLPRLISGELQIPEEMLAS